MLISSSLSGRVAAMTMNTLPTPAPPQGSSTRAAAAPTSDWTRARGSKESSGSSHPRCAVIDAAGQLNATAVSMPDTGRAAASVPPHLDELRTVVLLT